MQVHLARLKSPSSPMPSPQGRRRISLSPHHGLAHASRAWFPPWCDSPPAPWLRVRGSGWGYYFWWRGESAPANGAAPILVRQPAPLASAGRQARQSRRERPAGSGPPITRSTYIPEQGSLSACLGLEGKRIFALKRNGLLMELRHYLDDRDRDVFQRWLDALGDMKARVAITRRMTRVEQGNFGDHKYLDAGVSELRFDLGPGYRVYYAMDGETVVLLLGGGDKDSQERDIARAIAAWGDYQERNKP